MKSYIAECPRCGRVEFAASNPYTGIMQLVAHLRKDILELVDKLKAEKIIENKITSDMQSALKAIDAEVVIYPEKIEPKLKKVKQTCTYCGMSDFERTPNHISTKPDILTCKSCRVVQ